MQPDAGRGYWPREGHKQAQGRYPFGNRPAVFMRKNECVEMQKKTKSGRRKTAVLCSEEAEDKSYDIRGTRPVW